MRSIASNFASRTRGEWGLRVFFAAVTACVGYIATTHSLAMVLPASATELSYRLAPYDARIAAELSRQQLGKLSSNDGKPMSIMLAESEQLARAALKRDPTANSAATTLGLIEDIRGNKQAARDWFNYSERLSRRDLPTQLWLIEDAVGRENISEALHHYDVALRAKSSSWDILFPVLAQASKAPAISIELVQLLATRPMWTDAFLSYVAINNSDPAAVARLFLNLHLKGVLASDEANALVINALVGKREYDEAWAFFTSIQPGADRQQSRDPEFSTMLETASTLDWNVVREDSGLTATLQRSENGGYLVFSAPPSVGGPVLRQTQLLPPGRYVLKGRSVGINQPSQSLPYWVLTCIADGRELGRVPLSNSAEREGLFTGRISVPAGCPAQSLTLIARPSNVLEGLSGEVENVLLSPEG